MFNPTIKFEIGTEESIRKFSVDELEYLIIELKNKLPENLFDKIEYAVIQCGTGLLGNTNFRVFDEEKLIAMVNVCKKYNLKSKEHNGDYQTSEIIKKKFDLGLDSINIAPEFGKIETEALLEITEGDSEFFELLFTLCYNSKRWVKWVPADYNPFENKKELILISGHYVLSDNRLIDFLSENYKSTDIQSFIKIKIKNRLNELIVL